MKRCKQYWNIDVRSMTDDEFDLFLEHAEDCEYHAQFLEVLENQAKPVFELMFVNKVVPVKPFLPQLDAAPTVNIVSSVTTAPVPEILEDTFGIAEPKHFSDVDKLNQQIKIPVHRKSQTQYFFRELHTVWKNIDSKHVVIACVIIMSITFYQVFKAINATRIVSDNRKSEYQQIQNNDVSPSQKVEFEVDKINFTEKELRIPDNQTELKKTTKTSDKPKKEKYNEKPNINKTSSQIFTTEVNVEFWNELTNLIEKYKGTTALSQDKPVLEGNIEIRCEGNKKCSINFLTDYNYANSIKEIIQKFEQPYPQLAQNDMAGSENAIKEK